MRMKFKMTMEDLQVDDRRFDVVSLEWVEDVSQEALLRMSQDWISRQNFLTERMIGLTKVGESSLTIEPVAEQTAEGISREGDGFLFES